MLEPERPGPDHAVGAQAPDGFLLEPQEIAQDLLGVLAERRRRPRVPAPAARWQGGPEAPHMRGVQGPFQFDETAIGQFPWTKTGAVQDIGGTSNVLLTGQRPDASGCVW